MKLTRWTRVVPALDHLEDQVDAVVGQPDDHRGHLGAVAAGGAIGVDDALGVGLGGGDREGDGASAARTTRPSSSSSSESLPSKAIWLIDGFSTTVITSRPASGITSTSSKRPVSNSRRTARFSSSGVDRLARLDAGEDADGVRLDALVAGDVDPAEDRGALGETPARRQQREDQRPARRRSPMVRPNRRMPPPLPHGVLPFCPDGRFAALFVNSPFA